MEFGNRSKYECSAFKDNFSFMAVCGILNTFYIVVVLVAVLLLLFCVCIFPLEQEIIGL